MHGKREKGGVLFFITPSVFMASTLATLPSSPFLYPLTLFSRFTYLISQLALASVVFVIDSTKRT